VLNDFSLYIHFPWCVKKCPYCDFNSHQLKGTIPEDIYIEALIEDLKHHAALLPSRRLLSIFMGGGTPSLFSAAAIGRLLEAVNDYFPIDGSTEITMEANPGTVERKYFHGYRSAGVNRLSMGIQSLNDQHLKALGRIHDSSEAKAAITTAQQAGFYNINLDLMYGLPQQSVAAAVADLTSALAFNTPHLSWYQLTLEPNTLFYKQPPPLPTEEGLWEIQNAGQALLSKKGYHQYEVSAYSLPNQQCRHNLNYWQYGDYLGIGAGAHSKLTDAQFNILRTVKYKNPKDYLACKKNYIMEETVVPTHELPFEFMLNGLRLKEGINLALYTQRTGLALETIAACLKQAQSEGLLQYNEEKIKTTSHGWNFLNNLVSLFLLKSN